MLGLCMILIKTGGYSGDMIPTIHCFPYCIKLSISTDFRLICFSANLVVELCYLQVRFTMKKVTKGNVTIKL